MSSIVIELKNEAQKGLNQVQTQTDVSDKTNRVLTTIDLNSSAQSLADSMTFKISSGTIQDTHRGLDEAQKKAEGIAEGINQMIEDTIYNMVKNGTQGALSSMGINQDSISLAKSIINIADNGISNVANILSIMPTSVTIIPTDGGTTTSPLCASFMQVFMAKFMELRQQFQKSVNTMLQQMPNGLEVAFSVLDQLLIYIESQVEELLFKYTGFHLIEVYHYCADGYQLYKQWKEISRLKRSETEDGDVIYSKSKTKVVIDADYVKAQMMNWLSQQNDALYNCFLIIIVLDEVTSIRQVFEKLKDADLQSVADTINSLDDLIRLLDSLGCGNEANSIAIDEIVGTAINQYANAMNGLVETVSRMSDAVRLEGDKVYDLKTDYKTQTITMIIYQDPSKTKNGKAIYKLLSNAEDTQGNRIFSENDISIIQNAISYAHDQKQKSASVSLDNYKFNIEFNIKSEQENDDIYASPTYEYELGVVVEKQSSNPSKTAYRSTIELLHIIFKILNTLLPQMKTLAHLISNYKINKNKEKMHSHGNLNALVRLLAKKDKKDKHIDLKSHNFYPIRTLECYDYVTQNITRPNNVADIEIDVNQTKKLHKWLKEHGRIIDIIDTEIGTTLFFDFSVINDQIRIMDDETNRIRKTYNIEEAKLFVKYPKVKYQDGTFDNLLAVSLLENCDEELNYTKSDIYYNDSSLPMFGSQIMMAINKGYKAYE